MLYSQEEDSNLSTHRLALTMLIKIVKSLGCAYGCGEGHRGLSGDRLRIQVSVFELVIYGHVDIPFYYSKHWEKIGKNLI